MLLFIDKQEGDGTALWSLEIPIRLRAVKPGWGGLKAPIQISNGEDLTDRHAARMKREGAKVKERSPGRLHRFIELITFSPSATSSLATRALNG
jgi:hypothetical protein